WLSRRAPGAWRALRGSLAQRTRSALPGRFASGARANVAREIFLSRLDTRFHGDYATARLAERDRALVAGTTQERVSPLRQCRSPILEAGENRDVEARPEQPADEAAEAHALEAHYGAEPGDRCRTPEIAIAKRLLASVSLQAAIDRARSMNPS